MFLKRVIRRIIRVLRRPGPAPLIKIRGSGRELGGLDVLGFFSAEHGVGEASRVITKSLRSVGVSVSTIDYTDTESRRDHIYRTEEESRHKVLLTSINSDQLVAAHQRIQPDFFNDRYVIGQWFWELEESPPWFSDAYPFVDELWAPSRFIESMLKRSVPERIHVEYVPLPVHAPEIDPTLNRQYFGLDDRYLFLFMFDFMSVMKRKNPLGLIQAFAQAFSAGEGPQLVIKTINGDKRPIEYEALRVAALAVPGVTLIDKYFTKIETSTLSSLADCYVSLHRSEGLGLTMSEAMALGVPVIATGYSGNMDFMNSENSLMVPSSQVAVGEGAEGYSPHATWVEPDISVAASHMRYVYENQQEAREMGERGRMNVLGSLTIERSGAIMKSRLEKIWRSQHGS
jgi:glycosyltransferase involved in cell wall biosynthesis